MPPPHPLKIADDLAKQLLAIRISVWIAGATLLALAVLLLTGCKC